MNFDIGPIQVLAIEFGPTADYEGQALDELDRLETKGLIRVLDLLFVGHDIDADELVAFDYQGDDLGGLLGALLGFGFLGTEAGAVAIDSHGQSIGFSRDQLEQIVHRSKPDSAMALLLIEHVWARDFKFAIRRAGGIPVAEGFLSHELLQCIGQEIEETVMTIEELESQFERPVNEGSSGKGAST